MHHRSRSRLVMQFLSIIVIVTLVVPPGLAIAAPPIGQPQSSGPAPTSVSAPTATVSAWLSHIVRSARELLAEIQPTPTDSPLPSATAEIEPEETVTPSSPPTPVEQIITTLPEKGGSVALGSGRVEIRIPEGSLRESADVELSLFSPEGLDSDAKQVEPLVLFMLRLRKTDREEAVDKVARPIEAIVSIPRDVVELVNAGDKEVRLFRYAGDESKGFYIPSEQTLDAETGKLTATVELSDDAETTFGVMTTSSDDAPRGWILSWREPAVSEFSGAATYVYPIALPPARGNHQPNIDISYSSRDLDGRTKAAVDMNQGEIGVGWTINNIAVIREGAKVRQSSTSGFISFSHPDTFVLLINGIGYKLYTNQDVQNNIVRYYALNAPEVYVERRYDPNLADSNPDRFYWIVKTQDGTVYRLGYRDNSAAGQKMATCCSLASIEGHQGFDTDPSYQYSGIQWYVDMVTDVYNNQVQYIYEAWYETDNYEAYASGQWKQSAITTYHRRLKEIRYNFQGRTTGQYTWLNATPGTKVELVYTIDHRVDKIKLYHSNLSQPYRMIDLTVDTAWHDSCGQWTKTWRVTRITQQNADGSQALPPITFDYAPLAHTSGGCYIYDHLDEVHNGYGGGTRFIYGTQDGRQEPNVSSVEASYGRSYLVTQQQTWDSIHSQAAVTDYTYTKPCYNQTSGDLGDLAGAFNCPTSRHDADGPVVGFEETTVIRKNYNSATLNKTYTSSPRLWKRSGVL